MASGFSSGHGEGRTATSLVVFLEKVVLTAVGEDGRKEVLYLLGQGDQQGVNMATSRISLPILSFQFVLCSMKGHILWGSFFFAFIRLD